MDTPMHIKIAEAAVDWLDGDCSKFWTPWREQLAITSNYPDYFAAGEIKAAENEQRDADWRDYTLIPGHSPSVAHAIYKPLQIRNSYPAVTDYWLEQIYEHINSGNYAKAAKFAGTLSHIIGDTGQGAHVFDEQSLKRLLPHVNKRFIIHSTIERVHGEIIQTNYSPRLLGSTLAELKWRLIEELVLLKERNMAEVVPIMQAILTDDAKAATTSASRSLTTCAELFADLLYSVWQLTLNSSAGSTLALDLTELAPISQRCDMLANYEIMLNAIPGKDINHPLPLNLGGDNLKGIALLTELAQNYSTTRDAYVEYTIPANVFKKFTATVGLNHGSINETKAIFKVKLDGETVFTSPPLSVDDAGLAIELELGSATRLQLYVCDARPSPCVTKFFYPIFANPKINKQRNKTMIKKSNYQIECGTDGNFNLFNATGEMRFLKNNGIPFLPVTNLAVLWGEPEMKISENKIVYAMADNNLYEAPQTVLELHDDHIEFYFKAKVKQRMALNKWYLIQKDSEINALECLDFRSHIDSPAAYKLHQTVLGRRKLGTIGLDANTEDGDLMFAPHPMLFVFRHLADSMVIAPTELVAAESCHVSMIKGSTIISDYHIEIGRNIYWLEAGEELESPHFMINLTQDQDVYEALTSYTDILVKTEKVTPKLPEDVPAWALSPMWCSWGDQHTILDSAEVIHLATSAEARANACDNITEQMVNHVVKVIEEQQLPIRTLILDDKWYTHQGDMHVDTNKFPDFRGLVDKLHAKGFKVMAWASLYQFEYCSETYKNHPEWFILHHYGRNKGNPSKDLLCIDYSNPEIVDTYLGEMMQRLLSDKPGCYNLDGIKFDWPFLLPHDYPFADRNWVGKEKTIYNTQKLVYDYAKRAKPDSLIIGVSPHPFFNDTQDIIRTYDVSTFDTTIHTERAKYIKAIAPGMIPAMDEHVFHQNFFSYMEQSSELGIPMIYNILRFNGDGHVYTADDYAKLKGILDNYVEKSPRLKNYMASL